MSPFPTDLIPDILCRLSVKTLLRFKCVSKPWGSLVDDPYFAKLHLHHSLKTNTNVKLLLHDCIERDDRAYSVDFDSLANLVQFPRPFTSERIKNDSVIFASCKYLFRIFGSCNGLLALYHRDSGIALWNPSTRKCHYLPTIGDDITMDHDIIPGYDYDTNSILGFGYDVINTDYKVVKMLRSKTPNCFKVMVYSLKANSWRRIKDCPYDIPINYNDGAYVNGSLHWVGDEIGEYFGGKLIFALDLGAEKYYEVPECDIDVKDFGYKNVGELGGCLCVFRDGSTGYVEDNVVLWVMKEYGVKESWTELVYLSRDEWERLTLMNIFHTRAIAYSRSGDKILLDDGGSFRPAWFDLEKKTGETPCIPGAPQRFSAITYVESLVSVLPIND
ncbi:hypothetical protein REPUB_Repub14bG0036700 [Reevesia pubescens]